MRLLNARSFELHDFPDEARTPKYAILSHTWLRAEDGEEVLFHDLSDVTVAKAKRGWVKLEFTTHQAIIDELDYVWIDSCCIDKSSSSELSESINSMYRWYQNSQKCYVYLDDLPKVVNDLSDEPSEVAEAAGFSYSQAISSTEVSLLSTVAPESISGSDLAYYSTTDLSNSVSSMRSGPSHSKETFDHITQVDVHARNGGKLRFNNSASGNPPASSTKKRLSLLDKCRWFTRGWTLQEMVAAPHVEFYDESGSSIGQIKELAGRVAKITRVHLDLLTRRRPLSSFSIAQKMSWASERVTTRLEDRAYSLLGIFDISLAVIYGEGDRAFQRLQEELLRTHDDHTIFAWGCHTDTEHPRRSLGTQSDERREGLHFPHKTPMRASNLLATSPNDFSHEYCRKVIPVRRSQTQREYEILGRCINIDLPILDAPEDLDLTSRSSWTAVLNCCYENWPTRYIAIRLLRTPSGDFVRISLQYCDVYEAEQRCRPCSITILRYPSEAHSLIRHTMGNRDDFETILLRCRPVSGRGTLAIAKAKGYLVTKQRQNSWQTRRLSDNLWDETSGSFRIPRHYREHMVQNTPLEPYMLEAKVTLTSSKLDSPVIATLVVHPRPLFDEWARIYDWEFARFSFAQVKYEYSPNHGRAQNSCRIPAMSSLGASSLASRMASTRGFVMLNNWKPLLFTVKHRKLLHERFLVLEFSIGSRASLPFALVRTGVRVELQHSADLERERVPAYGKLDDVNMLFDGGYIKPLYPDYQVER